MQNPGLLFRDIRNMKKHNTITFSSTSKDIISSVKDLKKARSSQQIVNLKGFLQNKNEKIKNIDQKLEIHQNEIQRNNTIIEELTNNLMALKNQFTVERQKVQAEEKKNKQLRDEIERTNKMLKSKNMRIDELTKKNQGLDKQLEALKPYVQKLEEMTKTNNQLRKQLAKLQETLADRKGTLSDLNKEIERYKERINELGVFKAECQKYKVQIKLKDAEIEKLDTQIKTYEKENQSSKHRSQEHLHKLNEEIKYLSERLKQKQNQLVELRVNEKKYKQKAQKLETEASKLKSEVFGKQTFSQALKKQLKEAKQKFELVNSALAKRDHEQKSQSQKIITMKTKIEELKKKIESEQQQLQKLRPCGQKVQRLCKKTKNLEQLYNTMVPQIQCPYGHELNNPVTIIPCGHNYCLGCKKGYAKQCMLCNGKLKIEAVYRNQLMDDIMKIVSGVKYILETIR